MSSQGPKVSGTVDVNKSALQTLPPSVAVTAGYAFDKDVIRDGSDWTQYKKRQIILNEKKTKFFQDPWFVHGNQYRLDYLGGLFQNGAPTGCTGCAGGAYGATGPFPS